MPMIHIVVFGIAENNDRAICLPLEALAETNSKLRHDLAFLDGGTKVVALEAGECGQNAEVSLSRE